LIDGAGAGLDRFGYRGGTLVTDKWVAGE
jgi:hypothetical protein